MPHVKLSLHWSVIHYQVTFERLCRYGWERSIVSSESRAIHLNTNIFIWL